MDRVAIKTRAKELIKGNKWYIWKPAVIIGLITLAVSLLGFGLDYLIGGVRETVTEVGSVKLVNYSMGPFSSIVSIAASLIETVFAVWYAKYILDFVHGVKREFTFNEFFEYFKKNLLICFAVGLLVGLNIAIGYILLIVPGIMATFGLLLYQFVTAENLEMRVTDVLRKTWEMTKGHKMEIFVLMLSFIGWYFVAGLTLGILYIWLVPYVTVTMALTYEALKGTTK